MTLQTQLEFSTHGRGLYLITDSIRTAFSEWPRLGLLNCFATHTSCSLTLQENADPSAQSDLQSFSEKLAPDNLSWYQHTTEGPDDSPAHMKSATFGVSLNIPIVNHRLGLGTWQGIYLWEHRDSQHIRKIVLTTQGSDC